MTYSSHEKIILQPLSWNVPPSQYNDNDNDNDNENENDNDNYNDNNEEAHMQIKVQFEHESILTWTSYSSLSAANGTPFPRFILDLINQYQVKHLLIQSNSHSSSSSSSSSSSNHKHNDNHNDEKEYKHHFFPLSKSTGPSGVSIHALFEFDDNDNINITRSIDNDWQGLLRSLSGTGLVCAPLDAIRMTRHGHFGFHSDPKNEYWTHLPQEVGTLCGEAFSNFKHLLLPCECQISRSHNYDNDGNGNAAGIFASGPSPSILLGSSMDQDFHRRSVYIDIDVQVQLLHADKNTNKDANKESKITLTQGVEYTMTVPLMRIAQKYNPQQQNQKQQQKQQQQPYYGVSLSQIFLGNQHQYAHETTTKTNKNTIINTNNINVQNVGLNTQTLKACPLVQSSTLDTILSSSSSSTVPSHYEIFFGIAPTHNMTTTTTTTTKVNVCPQHDDETKSSSTTSNTSKSNTSSNTTQTQVMTVTHNLLELSPIDMNAPFLKILPIVSTSTPSSSSSSTTSSTTTSRDLQQHPHHNYLPEWGIHRTVKPQGGMSSAGVFHTVVRNGHTHTHTHTHAHAHAHAYASCITHMDLIDVYPTSIIQPLFHTLQIVLYQGNGAGQDSFTAHSKSYTHKTYLSKDNVIIQQSSPSQQQQQQTKNNHPTNEMEMTTLWIPNVQMPPDSSLWISMEYEPRFLSFESFPADPNRGFNVPSSIATFLLDCHNDNDTTSNMSSTSSFASPPLPHISPLSTPPPPSLPLPMSTRLYSSPLIVMAPVPDMSMPFNVISLTCTLYAFLMGTLMNILMKKACAKIKCQYLRKTPLSKKDKLKVKLMRMSHKVKDKVKDRFGFGFEKIRTPTKNDWKKEEEEE